MNKLQTVYKHEKPSQNQPHRYLSCPGSPGVFLPVRTCVLLATKPVMLAIVFLFPADTPTAAGSVLCSAKLECKLDAFHATEWSARATFNESNNQTGWSTLTVEAVDAEEAADNVQAFAAGFIEGRLTANLIDLEWVNLQIIISARAKKFVQENTQWVRSQIQVHPEDPYWVQVGLVIAQFDGLVAGYQSAPTWPQGNRSLTSFEILLIGMQPELGDVEKAVNPIARPDYSAMTPEALREYVYANSHCSAMIKVLPDLSELYSAHNTWTTFSDMGLRLWKVYKLPFATSAAQTVSFSGYAGKLAGIDDFYVTSQKLVVIETTNSVFNNSLFDSVTTSTVPYWVRVIVANQLAASSPAWHSVFYKFNSGTYNNQWMTVDYKLFTPKAPLPADLFWVSEQIPGYSAAADQTMALQRGHWPSYNVAFYADIYNMSDYPKIVQKFGPSESCEWIAWRGDWSGLEWIGVDWSRVSGLRGTHCHPIAIPSSLSATGSHRVPPSATECHRVPPSATECRRVPPSAAECHRGPLRATECR